MKKTPWWNPRLGPFSASLLIVVLHAVLKHLMAHHDIVSCLFAGSGQLPLWMPAVAVICGAVRAALFLMVPCLLVAGLSRLILVRVLFDKPAGMG